jgi:hypothetical protein
MVDLFVTYVQVERGKRGRHHRALVAAAVDDRAPWSILLVVAARRLMIYLVSGPTLALLAYSKTVHLPPKNVCTGSRVTASMDLLHY